MQGPGWLEQKAATLRARVAERPDDATALLDLGIAEKLLGHLDPAFAWLEGALAKLPPDAIEARQRALFVLALTWGDRGRWDDAVRCFERVRALDPASRIGLAAEGYGRAYREVHGLAG
jgi:tetratricopeptide (TPR) repeat protein